MLSLLLLFQEFATTPTPEEKEDLLKNCFKLAALTPPNFGLGSSRGPAPMNQLDIRYRGLVATPVKCPRKRWRYAAKVNFASQSGTSSVDCLQREMLVVAVEVHHNLRPLDQYNRGDHNLLRKAAHRQLSVWEYTNLGRHNRVPLFSCCVWAIRDRYPDPNGKDMGFKWS